MTDREKLEARAEELGLKYPAKIGDVKLSERVEEAEAEAKIATAAKEQGDVAGASEVKEAGLAKSLQPAPAEGQVKVLCAIAQGRRRGDRRWDGGETLVDLADLTPDTLKALQADPMFTVVLPA